MQIGHSTRHRNNFGNKKQNQTELKDSSNVHTLNQGWRGHLLALLAGALVTPSLAPFNFWPLSILSMAMLAWLLKVGS